MEGLKQFLHWLAGRMGYYLLPRKLRQAIIKVMILAEEPAPPRESVHWMLEIYDFVATAIDMQSIRWGNGVHIKHELMDGIHSFFYTRIPDKASVLDLGCGRGTVANMIALHSNASVLGIDLDKTSIEFAQKTYHNPNLSFIHGDVFKDIPDIPTVDVVVLSSVLEHLKMRAEFLLELTKRFHPKKFLIRVPTLERNHYVALKRELGISPFLDRTHILEYTSIIFKDEMEQANLNIISLEIRWGDIWAECEPRS
jgi:2-polyprenyl-3-methyl-5-hydroxy-6-metoxy-1,4-benzoquinol methylase